MIDEKILDEKILQANAPRKRPTMDE